MKYGHRLARRLEAYRTVNAYSPLARPCPVCEAAIGEACWNMQRSLYPVRQKKFHTERTRPRTPQEDQ